MTSDGDRAWAARVWTNWAIAALLVLGFAAIAGVAMQDPKSDPAAAGGSELASFLIQGTTRYSLEALVKAHGWTVTHRLELFDAIAVTAPAEQVKSAAPRWPGIIRVTRNHPLTSTTRGIGVNAWVPQQ